MTVERIEVVRWRCSHCRKSWSSKKSATKHEAACFRDVSAHGCGTCEHDDRGYPGSYDEGPGEDPHCSVGVDREGLPYITGCDQWQLVAWREKGLNLTVS